MKSRTLLLLLIPWGIVTGCANAPLNHALTTGALTVGGGVVGNQIGHGKPGATAIGTGVGFVAGEALQWYQTTAERNAFRRGYDQGRSDAAKRQYWIQQGQQRAAGEDQLTLYPIAIPAQEIDGVRYEPTTRSIPIYQ